jgi:hypothetical protein
MAVDGMFDDRIRAPPECAVTEDDRHDHDHEGGTRNGVDD